MRLIPVVNILIELSSLRFELTLCKQPIIFHSERLNDH